MVHQILPISNQLPFEVLEPSVEFANFESNFHLDPSKFSMFKSSLSYVNSLSPHAIEDLDRLQPVRADPSGVPFW